MPGGLKEQIPDDKLGIADQVYRGENTLTTNNPFDGPAVRKFKS
jgi:hypothetical protein